MNIIGKEMNKKRARITSGWSGFASTQTAQPSVKRPEENWRVFVFEVENQELTGLKLIVSVGDMNFSVKQQILKILFRLGKRSLTKLTKWRIWIQ